MSIRKVIACGAPVLCLAVSAYAAPAAQASGSAIVAPGHLSEWRVVTNRTAGGPYDSSSMNPHSTAGYQFVDGPGTPPLGTGSLLLHTGPVANSRVSALIPGLEGRTLEDVSELRYDTYLENVSSTGHTSPINLKFTGTSIALGHFFTAVFEPRKQPSHPVTHRWQSWNALAGEWWASMVTGACSQSDPCSWREFVERLGDDTIIRNPHFELGDSGTQFLDVRCAMDDVNINGVRYDFERTAPPGTPNATATHFVVGPGGFLTVHGTGFHPGEHVRATLHSSPVVLGTGIANSSGHVSIPVRIPPGTPSGRHMIELLGLTSGRVAVVEIDIVGPGGGPETGFGGMSGQVSGHHPGA